MRLQEKIRILATPEVVWAYLADPNLWPGFVPKIQIVEPLEDDFYRIEIGGKEVIGKIELLVPSKRMRFAGQLTNQSKESAFAIEYLIDPKPNGVVVSEIQEFHIPFPFSIIVWLISRFGTPQSETNLQILKELCEAGRK